VHPHRYLPEVLTFARHEHRRLKDGSAREHCSIGIVLEEHRFAVQKETDGPWLEFGRLIELNIHPDCTGCRVQRWRVGRCARALLHRRVVPAREMSRRRRLRASGSQRDECKEHGDTNFEAKTHAACDATSGTTCQSFYEQHYLLVGLEAVSASPSIVVAISWGV
jgi:hypothetical protein